MKASLGLGDWTFEPTVTLGLVALVLILNLIARAISRRSRLA